MARTVDRGYGAHHRRLREQFARLVATGTCPCARCGELIHPGEGFDLDHDDHDRSLYIGASHIRCNRATDGRQTVDPECRPSTNW